MQWSDPLRRVGVHAIRRAQRDFIGEGELTAHFPPFFFSLVRDVMLQDQIEDMTLFESSLYFYCRLNSF